MKSHMPNTFALARRFGYAASYTAIRHPSLSNDIAIFGGQTCGITNNDKPSASPVRGTSVFGSAVAAGKTAAYVDWTPENCAAWMAAPTTRAGTTRGRTSPTNAPPASATTSLRISSAGRSPTGRSRRWG